MDVLVWTFAGIFLVNAVTVAILGVVVEVRQRRYEREVRELELIYEAPPAPVPMVALRRGTQTQGRHVAAGVTSPGKHVAVAVSDPRRQGAVRTASFVLAVVSILVVIMAALASPTEDPETAPRRAADGIDDEGLVLGSEAGSGPDQARRAIDRDQGFVPIDPQQGPGAVDEDIDLDAPGQNVVESGGEVGIPAVVVAAPASPTSIRIAWRPVPSAIKYEVDRWVEGDADSAGGWVTIRETSADVSAITDTGLDAATTYYYRVTAGLEGGEEAPASDVVSATTMIEPPQAPELSAKVAGTKVVLHWTDVEGETGYRIERLAPGETEWVLLDTTAAGEVTVRDEDLSKGLTYQYRVIATGLGGESVASNVVEIVASISIGEAPPPSEDPTPDATEPDAADSIATELAATDPIVTDPIVTDPMVTEPAATEPAATEPAATEPHAIDTGAVEPAEAPSG
jgi:hypothetical protein